MGVRGAVGGAVRRQPVRAAGRPLGRPLRRRARHDLRFGRRGRRPDALRDRPGTRQFRPGAAGDGTGLVPGVLQLRLRRTRPARRAESAAQHRPSHADRGLRLDAVLADHFDPACLAHLARGLFRLRRPEPADLPARPCLADARHARTRRQRQSGGRTARAGRSRPAADAVGAQGRVPADARRLRPRRLRPVCRADPHGAAHRRARPRHRRLGGGDSLRPGAGGEPAGEHAVRRTAPTDAPRGHRRRIPDASPSSSPPRPGYRAACCSSCSSASARA